jgi:hypothetical protein
MKKSIIFLNLFFISQAWALSCSAPVNISEPGETHCCSKAALNEKGEAVVAWKAFTDEESIFLQAATCNAEKKWSAAETLGDFEERIDSAELYIDSDGNAFAGWCCERDQETLYKFSKKKKQGWCPAITVAGPEDLTLLVAADFDLQGNPIILGMPAQDTIKVLHYHHATAQKIHQRFSASQPFPFQVVRNKLGELTAWWVVPHKNWLFQKSDYVVQQIKLKENGEWSSPTTLCKLGFTDISNEQAAHLFSSVNSNENFALIWVSWNKQVEDMKVHAVVSIDRRVESIDIATSKAGFCSPKILMDDQENTLAVWVGLLKNRRAVFASYKPKGQPWSLPVPLSNSLKNAEKFELTQDHQGHFIVVWNETSPKLEHLIYGATFSIQAQEWSLALLSPADQCCEQPSIAFNEKGQGIIAWSNWNWDKKQFNIQAAELKID